MSAGTAAALAVPAGVLGLLVGSLLNVVVWRVPRGESVVRPRSACPGCRHPIRPRDDVPVVSWLLLRGRCRDCAAPISTRYPLVELGTAALFALVTLRLGASWALPAFLYLAGAGVALALIDLDVRRLPDSIVLPSYGVAGALLALACAGSGDWGAGVRALGGMAALYAVYLALALAKPGGMGFGDVKLAGVLGMYLGWLGWTVLLVGGFLAFLLGGLAGALLMALGRAQRTTALPFGPFMLAGALVAVLGGDSLVRLYTDLLL